MLDKPIPEVIAELRDQLGEAILADFKGRAYNRFSVGAANAFPRIADEIERLTKALEAAERERDENLQLAMCPACDGAWGDHAMPCCPVCEGTGVARDVVVKQKALAESYRKALEPFARFGAYIEANPRGGLDDLLYAWDGLDWGVRKSDLIAASALAPTVQPPLDLCPNCHGKGEEADYVGLEMRCVGVECSKCGGTGFAPIVQKEKDQ